MKNFEKNIYINKKKIVFKMEPKKKNFERKW